MAPDLDIIELLKKGDFFAAVALAQRNVEAHPQIANAHYMLARAQAAFGNRSEALRSAEKACALAPRNFTFQYYCGQLFGYFDLYELALPYLQRSVGIEARAPMSQFYLGRCYLDLGISDKAIVHIREAMRLSPNAPEKEQMRFFLARALLANNKHEEANKLLERLAQTTNPYRIQALCLMAGAPKQLPDGQIGKKLLTLLDTENLNNGQLRSVYLALGKLQASVKNTDLAFENWTKAASHARAEKWNLRDHHEIISDHKIFYTRELFEKCRPFANSSSTPVFIVGMPRSGTTLTEQILAAHSKVVGVGELARWERLNIEFMRDNTFPLRHEAIVEKARNGELRQRGEEDLLLFRTVAGEIKDRVVEKTPHNFMSMGYPALIFSNAHFIHIRRHPADAFLSAFQSELNAAHGYAFDQETYVKEYLFQEDIMAYWKSVLPGRITTIKYEDLTTNPEIQVRQLLTFLGLEWEPNCLNFFERESTVKTLSYRQVRQPVHTSSIEKWRIYEKHLAPLFSALKEAGFEYN